jgi:hypothetical protein
MRIHVRFALLATIVCAILAASAAAAQAIEPPTLFAANCNAAHETCGKEAKGPKEEKEAEEQGEQEAGKYVPFGVSDFVLKTELLAPGLKAPVGYATGGSVKNARFDAGPGVVTNPFAVPRCEMKDFEGKEVEPVNHFFTAPTCLANTVIGKQFVEIVLPDPTEPVEPKKFKDYNLEGLVYNLQQPNGLASDFGVALNLKPYLGLEVFGHSFIEGNVEWASDYHDYYIIKNITPGLIESRLVLKGNENEPKEKVRFIRNPSACVQKGPETTSSLTVEPYVGTAAEATYTDLVGTKNCGLEKFEPLFSLKAGSGEALSDGPDGITAELTDVHPNSLVVPDTSDLKTATVTMPKGMSLNESAAAGIEGCTPEQIGIGTRNATACPAHSRIGTVNLEVPTLPADQLKGPIFLGKPAAGPITGPPFTIYLDAESARYGVKVRLKGTVEANPETGQLTTTFSENPPAPFNTAILHFDGGAHAAVSNALACTGGKVNTAFAPFSGTETVHGELPFNSEGCAATIPFSLTQNTQAKPATAGASTNFTFTLVRSDGNQYPASIRTVLPAGLAGRIPAVALCPEKQANSEAEACPAASRLGSVRAAVGSGPEPYTFTGSAYLTGPYAGAPYGLSVKVPVVAGPFNLGTEVKRAKVEVEPHTGRVIVTSELPTIRAGILVRLKSLSVTVSRQDFMLNPTNCGVLATESTVSSTTGGLTNLSSPFQAEGCNALAFKPSFSASTTGKTSKANGASLEVKITQPEGQANIRSVKTSLPIALPSRLTTLQKACLEATFAANPLGCPEVSKVGTATAVTPLLPNPMTGPAFLVSHGGAAFPDLDLVLEGNNGVRIILVGNTDIKKGITTTTFASNPDAPVTSFVLNLPTGPHSALAANGNLCVQKLVMPTTMVAQNGAQITQNTPIALTGCPVRIASRRTSGATAVLKVQVYEAGRVSAGGGSLRGVSQRVNGPGTITVRVPLSAGGRRRHRPFKTRVKVSFVPSKKGAARSSASALVRFG